jgi:glycosyltransferase involved in cell wall biosynthesis
MTTDHIDHYFTVFTPTYNRSHVLSRVYNSLRKQTFTDFEWLIIDDGSTDATAEMVKGWQKNTKIPIRYYFQENQGKHIAWNKAADLAQGKYFLCADSDDEFVPESLESFYNCFESIPVQERDGFYGASALCKTPRGNVVGDSFPDHIFASNFNDLYFRFKIRSEKWNCGRTRIHREIRFEETFRNSYLPEGTVWFKIAKKYKVALLNLPLRIYHAELDSICHTSSFFKNYPGMLLLTCQTLNDDLITYWKYSLPLFIDYATAYSRSCFHSKLPVWQQFERLNNMFAKVLWAIMLPKGYCLYHYDKYRNAKVKSKEMK